MNEAASAPNVTFLLLYKGTKNNVAPHPGIIPNPEAIIGCVFLDLCIHATNFSLVKKLRASKNNNEIATHTRTLIHALPLDDTNASHITIMFSSSFFSFFLSLK
jgi:hypothetical protein